MMLLLLERNYSLCSLVSGVFLVLCILEFVSAWRPDEFLKTLKRYAFVDPKVDYRSKRSSERTGIDYHVLIKDWKLIMKTNPSLIVSRDLKIRLTDLDLRVGDTELEIPNCEILVGHIAGSQDSEVLFTICGGEYRGSIQFEGKLYLYESLHDGRHVLYEAKDESDKENDSESQKSNELGHTLEKSLYEKLFEDINLNSNRNRRNTGRHKSNCFGAARNEFGRVESICEQRNSTDLSRSETFAARDIKDYSRLDGIRKNRPTQGHEKEFASEFSAGYSDGAGDSNNTDYPYDSESESIDAENYPDYPAIHEYVDGTNQDSSSIITNNFILSTTGSWNQLMVNQSISITNPETTTDHEISRTTILQASTYACLTTLVNGMFTTKIPMTLDATATGNYTWSINGSTTLNFYVPGPMSTAEPINDNFTKTPKPTNVEFTRTPMPGSISESTTYQKPVGFPFEYEFLNNNSSDIQPTVTQSTPLPMITGFNPQGYDFNASTSFTVYDYEIEEDDITTTTLVNGMFTTKIPMTLDATATGNYTWSINGSTTLNFYVPGPMSTAEPINDNFTKTPKPTNVEFTRTPMPGSISESTTYQTPVGFPFEYEFLNNNSSDIQPTVTQSTPLPMITGFNPQGYDFNASTSFTVYDYEIQEDYIITTTTMSETSVPEEFMNSGTIEDHLPDYEFTSQAVTATTELILSNPMEPVKPANTTESMSNEGIGSLISEYQYTDDKNSVEIQDLEGTASFMIESTTTQTQTNYSYEYEYPVSEDSGVTSNLFEMIPNHEYEYEISESFEATHNSVETKPNNTTSTGSQPTKAPKPTDLGSTKTSRPGTTVGSTSIHMPIIHPYEYEYIVNESFETSLNAHGTTTILPISPLMPTIPSSTTAVLGTLITGSTTTYLPISHPYYQYEYGASESSEKISNTHETTTEAISIRPTMKPEPTHPSTTASKPGTTTGSFTSHMPIDGLYYYEYEVDETFQITSNPNETSVSYTTLTRPTITRSSKPTLQSTITSRPATTTGFTTTYMPNDNVYEYEYEANEISGTNSNVNVTTTTKLTTTRPTRTPIPTNPSLTTFKPGTTTFTVELTDATKPTTLKLDTTTLSIGTVRPPDIPTISSNPSTSTPFQPSTTITTRYPTVTKPTTLFPFEYEFSNSKLPETSSTDGTTSLPMITVGYPPGYDFEYSTNFTVLDYESITSKSTINFNPTTTPFITTTSSYPKRTLWYDLGIIVDPTVVFYLSESRVWHHFLHLMNRVSRMFMHPSLDSNIVIILTKFLILRSTKNVEVDISDRNALDLVNRWNYKTHNGESTTLWYTQHYGPNGYTEQYSQSVCLSFKSCGIIRDYKHNNIYLTSHALGLILYNCMRSYPTSIAGLQMPDDSYIASEFLHLDSQCQKQLGSNFAYCRKTLIDPCRELWCYGKNIRCKWTGKRAMEGTFCKKNGDLRFYCYKGKCRKRFGRNNMILSGSIEERNDEVSSSKEEES